MKAAALLAWVGRFLFLGLFYYFLYHVYRSIMTAELPQGRASLILTRSSSNVQYALWVEEPSAQKRRLSHGSSIPIAGTLKLGRGADNDLRTNDPYVSQTHFAIHEGPDGFVLNDVYSTNGTYVDGVKITETTELTSGCEIQAGSWRFRFEVT